MPSLLGGQGFQSGTSLSNTAMSSISAAIRTILQNDQYNLGLRHDSIEREKQRKFQDDQRKKQESAQKKAMWTQMGVGVAAGAAGAGLGALAAAPAAAGAGAAGGAAAGGIGAGAVEAAVAPTAFSAGLGSAVGGATAGEAAGLAAGSFAAPAALGGAVGPTVGNAAALSGGLTAGNTAAIGGGVGGLAGSMQGGAQQQYQPPSPTRRFFTGAGLGAMDALAGTNLAGGYIGNLQSAPYRDFQMRMGQARENRMATNDAWNQKRDASMIDYYNARTKSLGGGSDGGGGLRPSALPSAVNAGIITADEARSQLGREGPAPGKAQKESGFKGTIPSTIDALSKMDPKDPRYPSMKAFVDKSISGGGKNLTPGQRVSSLWKIVDNTSGTWSDLQVEDAMGGLKRDLGIKDNKSLIAERLSYSLEQNPGNFDGAKSILNTALERGHINEVEYRELLEALGM